MTVQIHTPTIHEVTQAVYNLNATKYLLAWHDYLKETLGPITHVGFVDHNPLAHVTRPLDILDQPGDLVLDDDIPMTVLCVVDKDGNPVEPESIIEPFVPVPFTLRPPDTGVYYMVSTEEINGKKYSYFRPCHPSEKPGEGETLQRFEKPLRLSEQTVLQTPSECTITETSLTSVGIRTPIPEGSFEQPTVTQTGWGPANFQFKY